MNNPDKSNAQPIRLKKYFWAVVGVWTAVIAAVFVWNYVQLRPGTLDMARIEARTSFEKDAFYRKWNAMHGGVYVPVTEKTPPNPYLSHVPERDINTLSSRSLTLINPAYMTRQVHELTEGGFTNKSHITSLNPLNPHNTADPWEREALKSLHRGATEVSSVIEIKGEAYMRLMRACITKKECLKCHAAQGYKEGDIRGGISVSVLLSSYFKIERQNMIASFVGYGLLLLLGLVGLGWVTWKLEHSMHKRHLVEEQIKESLKEKEVLLREIHHRVKNNMQVITSLLRLQYTRIKDKQDLAIFEESRSRIYSMALVHDKLYQSKNLANIEFKEYVDDLIRNLFTLYRINTNKISLKIEMEKVLLEIDLAIPCGLIINELVTNSLKHAFPQDKKGEIRIALSSVNDEKYELIVSDDGIGMSEDSGFRNTESFGLHLVKMLAEGQLEGKVELSRTEGTGYHIHFKRPVFSI